MRLRGDGRSRGGDQEGEGENELHIGVAFLELSLSELERLGNLILDEADDGKYMKL